MTISIRLNGLLARDAGTSRLALELDDDSTVSTLIERLGEQYPQLAPRLSRVAVAAGGRVVSHDEPLRDGDEVAFLVPVAGGAHRSTH